MAIIIGRKYEQMVLKRCFESTSSEFVALYGRRRVGKTFLVRQYFENKFAFTLTGMADANMASQLLNPFCSKIVPQIRIQLKLRYKRLPKNGYVFDSQFRHFIKWLCSALPKTLFNKNILQLCGMYFKATYRHNPKTDKSDWYFRLVESYRNVLDEVRQRTVLSVGFLSDFNGDQIDLIEKGICNRITGQQSLFEDADVRTFVEALYQRMIKEKKVDLGTTNPKKDIDTVDLNTLKNKDVREVGAEWLSLQAVRELGIDCYLSSRGWSDEDVSLALSHIVSRAVYPASELKTVRLMEDNSSICELTGYDIDTLNKDKLYGITKKLFAEKQGLENYLSKKTNDLFDLEDEIILYDLTNSYFEGEKRRSQLARYGRSKENGAIARWWY